MAKQGLSVKTKLNLKQLERYRRILNADLKGSGNGPVRRAMRQWSHRYKTFIRRRYSRFSRGGGDWPPLSPITIARKGSTGILVDTGTMFGATDPQFFVAGWLNKSIRNGITVGFGGPGSHPSGEKTIAQLAEIHQTGKGNNPVRKIIVPPDQGTIRLMVGDMRRAMIVLDKMTDKPTKRKF